MLTIEMLNVITPSVTMLSVKAPIEKQLQFQFKLRLFWLARDKNSGNRGSLVAEIVVGPVHNELRMDKHFNATYIHCSRFMTHSISAQWSNFRRAPIAGIFVPDKPIKLSLSLQGKDRNFLENISVLLLLLTRAKYYSAQCQKTLMLQLTNVRKKLLFVPSKPFLTSNVYEH
jgi:hypothetical protein